MLSESNAIRGEANSPDIYGTTLGVRMGSME